MSKEINCLIVTGKMLQPFVIEIRNSTHAWREKIGKKIHCKFFGTYGVKFIKIKKK